MRTSHISIVTATALLMTACTGFLEEEPTTKLDQEVVYTTVEGAEAALTGCYAPLGTGRFLCGLAFEGLSDTSGLLTYKNQQGTGDAQQLYSLTLLPNDQSWLTPVYSNMYNVINRTNDLIENLKESPIDERIKEEILGEAYFLRANMYFFGVRIWGPLPLVTVSPKSVKETHIPRTPIEKIYEQIIDDLEKAETRMRKSQLQGGTQRVDRPCNWAATATLAKVYMQMACILRHNDGEPFSGIDFGLTEAQCWEKCYDYAKSVHDKGPYSLVPKYADIFDVYEPNNCESIFEIQTTTASTNYLTERTIPNYSHYTPEVTASPSTWGRIRPTREIFLRHQARYPGDPRFEATYIYNEFTRSKNAVDGNGVSTAGKKVTIFPASSAGSAEATFPYLKKYIDPDYRTGASNKNLIYFRYGELLLILAEAAVEHTTTAEAVGYVNELLKRARYQGEGQMDAAQPQDWEDTFGKEELRDAILQERVYELMGEMQEWFDVRRNGIDYFLNKVAIPHNDYMNTQSDAVKKQLAVYPTDHDGIRKILLWPLPMDEINTNNAISTADQNFGYNATIQ